MLSLRSRRLPNRLIAQGIIGAELFGIACIVAQKMFIEVSERLRQLLKCLPPPDAGPTGGWSRDTRERVRRQADRESPFHLSPSGTAVAHPRRAPQRGGIRLTGSRRNHSASIITGGASVWCHYVFLRTAISVEPRSSCPDWHRRPGPGPCAAPDRPPNRSACIFHTLRLPPLRGRRSRDKAAGRRRDRWGSSPSI